MVLFFVRGQVDSDEFIRFCYGNYRDLCGHLHGELPDSAEIIREKNKKPCLDVEGVYFNLSHSHGVVMLGMSHTEIGVDVEKVRPVDMKKFTFIDAEDEEEFFEKWTERESYAKFTGEGISVIRKEIPDNVNFEHFDLFGGYHACVCAPEQNIRAFEIDPNAVGENR